MCFLFNNVNFLFLLLFIINVESDDSSVLRNENRSEKFRRKFVTSDVSQPEPNFRNHLESFMNQSESFSIPSSSSPVTATSASPRLQYDLITKSTQSSVNYLTSEKFDANQETNTSNNANNDIRKSSNDSDSSTIINKINAREIESNKSSSNDLYYEILQTKPNTTVWSKFEFLIKPSADRSKVEESNGIIYSRRKNLTLPNNNSSVPLKADRSNDELSKNETLVMSERNATDGVNITDRHFNSHSKFNQDSWTQVSTLQSNKDQIDRFKYPTLDNTSVHSKNPPTKNIGNLSNVNLNVNKNIENFNSLKRHTLAALDNKYGDNGYSNIPSTSGATLAPSYHSTSSSNQKPTISSSSLTTISTSTLQKPFGPMYHTSTNVPNENQKQKASGYGQVVSTTHKSWIHNHQNKQSVNDYYSAIITAADAIKKKHKPVSSTETVLFPYYDEELVTPVLISSTKKPIQLSALTKKPLFSSTSMKPFNPVITLTKKPDFEYQTEVDTDDEEEDEENEEQEAQPEQEEGDDYTETTTQMPVIKSPPKPLFVSTAKPVYTKRPYIIRPVINVISTPVSSTRKPIIAVKPITTTTTTTTTTQVPPTTEKQLTTALVTVPATSAIDTEDGEDDDEDDSDDSDAEASEERKRRRKRPHPYLPHTHQTYPLVHAMSSPAPFLLYQQPLQTAGDQEADKNNDSGDDDDDDDDDFFVNPLADDDDEDEDDEIVEETLEVHKSPHGVHGHIYDGKLATLISFDI